MNLEIEMDSININGMLKTSKSNGKKFMSHNVFSTNTLKNIEMMETNLEIEELMDHLVKEGKYVYVNFSSNVMDNELNCIDGNTYLYLNDEEAEEYYEDEEIPTYFIPYKNLRVYEDTSVGYLLKYERNKLHIKSGIIDVTNSSIDIVDDLELLKKPMESYLFNFIK
ncbi:hypothetical protein [Fictibacillus arsenicus]|uniref:Uncharacterized protein n=1 Tax=Fictibacillus arsenicus TaxID=255247 RepID=A0A1V3G7W4_9BACL|nr:hypothetical protein [Fictibacillus arsenicus]OOE12490.1 hypothetical protein UN64_10415 [Fictibacillus arsenicus]